MKAVELAEAQKDCRPLPSVNKIRRQHCLPARADHKITKAHDLFLFMTFHKVTLESVTSVHTVR
jgi:hypothetical protein